MSDLVNDTHKTALSPRNSEPSHLSGQAPYTVIGGPTPTSEFNGSDYKIDATNGVSQDNSIPKSVGPESSHLKTEEDTDPDVKFDDEVNEGDELDKALDEVADVDVDVQSDTDDDKKDEVNEEDENPDDKDKEPIKEEEDKDDDSDDEDKDKNKKPFPVNEKFTVRIKFPNVALNEDVIPAKNQAAVRTLFEQTLRSTTKQVSTQLNKHYKGLYESRAVRYEQWLANKVDKFLSLVVEEWMTANRPQVQTAVRGQMNEDFITALHRVFLEHYIDVPEGKVNVVENLTTRVNKLTKQLNEQTEKTVKMRQLAEAANKARHVSEAARTRELSEAQASELSRLIADVPYTSAKDFKGRLSTICENYFPKEKPTTQTLAEETVQDPPKTTSGNKTEGDLFAASISRPESKFDW